MFPFLSVSVSGQQLGQPVGGLPKLFPPVPRTINCSDSMYQNDCESCTSASGCGFCYTGLDPDSTASNSSRVLGRCFFYVDMQETRKCPTNDRYYTQGMCMAPLRPGCSMTPTGECFVRYLYDDRRGVSETQSAASGGFILLIVALATMLVASFSYRFYPYYEKWEVSDESEFWGHWMIFAFILQTVALILNRWGHASDVEFGERHHGPFGFWYSYADLHSYACTDEFVHPASDINTCRSMYAATLLTGICACASLFFMFVRFVRTWFLCCYEIEPHHTKWWRVDYFACLGSGFAVLFWSIAYVLLEQSMVRPQQEFGGSFSSMVVGPSWILQICGAILLTYVVIVEAVGINCASAAYSWVSPDPVVREAKRKAKQQTQQLEVAAKPVTVSAPFNISTPVHTATAVKSPEALMRVLEQKRQEAEAKRQMEGASASASVSSVESGGDIEMAEVGKNKDHATTGETLAIASPSAAAAHDTAHDHDHDKSHANASDKNKDSATPDNDNDDRAAHIREMEAEEAVKLAEAERLRAEAQRMLAEAELLRAQAQAQTAQAQTQAQYPLYVTPNYSSPSYAPMQTSPPVFFAQPSPMFTNATTQYATSAQMQPTYATNPNMTTQPVMMMMSQPATGGGMGQALTQTQGQSYAPASGDSSSSSSSSPSPPNAAGWSTDSSIQFGSSYTPLTVPTSIPMAPPLQGSTTAMDQPSQSHALGASQGKGTE